MSIQTILLVMSGRAWLTQRAVHGIASYARQHTHWELMLVTTEGQEVLPLPSEIGARGAIVSVNHPECLTYQNIAEPLVTIESTAFHGLRPNVGLDNPAIGTMAAEYYLGRGYRHFAYLGNNTPSSNERRDAFRGNILEKVNNATFRNFLGGLRVMHRPHAQVLGDLVNWLGQLPLPIAVFAFNDHHALILSQACRLAGLRVPEDVAILGVNDNDLFTNLGHVAMSSIAIASERMGYEAAAFLDAMLRGEKVKAVNKLIAPVGVVTRRSTDCLAVDDDQIRSALTWIAQNLRKPFGVEDLLDALPMSRSLLERRFKAILNRTPHDEILRQRIERARSLLVDTDWTLPQIAAECGFAGREYFGTVFKRATGESPAAYRKRFQRRLDG